MWTNCNNVILQFANTFNCYLTTQMSTRGKQMKQKMANFFSENFSELSNFSSSSFWEKPLWNQKLLLLTATARRSCYILVRPVPALSCFTFFQKLFWNKFLATQNKNNVIETISYFVYQLSKKYSIYYVSEHLKYSTQLNEYWLNKNACLNIV